MSQPIRILVAEDHTIVREGLVAILERESDLEVIAEARDGQEALEKFRIHRPDVILTDLQMPLMSGSKLVKAIRIEDPQAQIILLTTYDGDDDIYQCLQAGAKAYLLKGVPRAELFRTIRTVYAGKKYFSSDIGNKLAEHADFPALSPREREVVNLMVLGTNNQNIAKKLSIAEGTVKFHIGNIMGKLQVSDRTQVVVTALRRGISHL